MVLNYDFTIQLSWKSCKPGNIALFFLVRMQFTLKTELHLLHFIFIAMNLQNKDNNHFIIIINPSD